MPLRPPSRVQGFSSSRSFDPAYSGWGTLTNVSYYSGVLVSRVFSPQKTDKPASGFNQRAVLSSRLAWSR